VECTDLSGLPGGAISSAAVRLAFGWSGRVFGGACLAWANHYIRSVSDEFELRDPFDAQALLGRVQGQLRQKGEALFRAGRVQELVTQQPGAAYWTRVVPQDIPACRVSLRYEAGGGWRGSCSCPKRERCEHIYAAMCALLAEHRAVVVRGLSASLRPAMPLAASPAAPPAPEDARPIIEGLTAALGRRLTNQEFTFVQRIRGAYIRCRQARRISYWDFAEMGLALGSGNMNWAALEIWPAFPQTLLEFWLYVANAAVERGLQFPEFMRSLTNLEPVRERLATWRRVREIQQWKQTLERLGVAAATAAPAGEDGQYDLRLVIEAKTARLQARRPGAADFEPLAHAHFNRFYRQREQGRAQLAPEAEMLWRLLSSVSYGPPTTEVHFEQLTSMSEAMLGRILRAPVLESRIVTPAGQPLARPSEPLRWGLLPAASHQDDYRLHLVQANGAPAPKLLCLLAGWPMLYLTAGAVFQGPPSLDPQLDPRKEIRIPAPAIESRRGVAFLQALRLEMPERLRQRVRTLPLEVVIHCELEPIEPESPKEDCVLRVVAQAADGHREVFNGRQWVESTERSAPQPEARDSDITIYERAPLAAIPALLEPLNLKFEAWASRLVLRVTRKFPERFGAWLKSVPPSIAVRLEGELASFATAEIAGRVRLDVAEAEIDWFDLRVVLDVADLTLTQEEIRLLLNAKGRYVRLEGRGWRRLQFDLSPEEDERLARLGLNPRELSAEPQRLHALQLADDAASKFLPEQQVQQIQRRASELKTRITPNLPAGVTAELRPYQVEGFHFLAYLATNSFGGILADDMGLGKTLQGLAWLLWLRQQALEARQENGAPEGAARPLPSLVVCPKSVMDNWHAEAARFTPALRVKAWPAAELPALAGSLDQADLHVLNYAQLRSLAETLAPIPWLAVILDEGQYIKNPASHTARAARALRARHRLVLSGTPIENRLLDLWSLMSFAMPGLLGQRAQFAKLYDAKDDLFARRRLSARVRPFLLRRTKSQVAKDLPDRIEEDLFCEIEGEQKTLYRAELKRAQQLLLALKTQRELAEQQFHFLTSLLRLRQICCHPRLLDPHFKGASAKTEALLEQLEPLMEEDQKVLVFSQFVTLLDLLRPELEHRGWPVFYLAGQTENRGELVHRFQTAEGAAVFLISLKAGGFGLNLTAASYVVLFDPWWNPAVENQAIDRTHRIGQASKVIAYRLLIKDSIEEKIRRLQRHKSALAEEILGEERFAQSLTLEDLRFLLAD